MSRPSMFDERKQINIYLDKTQLDWLKNEALKSGISPSAVIRLFINARMGLLKDIVGPRGTNNIKRVL